MAVLWMVAGGAAMGLVLAGAAHTAIGASTNRITIRQSAWHAEGCVQSAMATVGALLATDAGHVWAAVDSVLDVSLTVPRDCVVRAEPLGARLSLVRASREQLAALFRLPGTLAARADSLAAAIDDWRDTDHVPLPSGAEDEWYTAHRRPRPRNAPFASVNELSLVRDCCDSLAPLHLLSAEGGRVYVARAPDPVLAAATGLSLVTVAHAKQHARGALRISDLVSAELAERGASAGPVVTDLLTDSPDGWLLTAQSTRGDPPVTVSVEYLVTRSGPRLALLRRRSWP